MGSRQTVLIVDDDRHILEVLEARLASAGFRVFTSPGVAEALDIIHSQQVDLIISDIRMPGLSGMDLFREIQSFEPGLPVIFLTAYGTIPDAVNAVKAGAVDYLTKPFDGRELVHKVKELFKGRAHPSSTGGTAPTASAPLPADPPPTPHAPSPPAVHHATHGPHASHATHAVQHGTRQTMLGGKSPAMLELQELIERVAPSDVNVLILGESGVGKERVAKLLHQKGPRRDAPFIVVDCGSTPTGLLESELFGHVRGSFTHAIRDKKGLIEAADRGTLFLDEIGNISPEMQVRLLRFLEERKIRRIGDIKEIPVDCRVIAATNVDLPSEVEAGNFREDLYYRLRVVTLRIPPVRERKEDIPVLALHFVESYCEGHGLPRLKIAPETVKWLTEYPWPGNVRELKNALEGAVVLCRNGFLRPSDLQAAGLPDVPRRSPTPSAQGAPAPSTQDALSLEENEKNAIVRALQQTGWVQKDAAQVLGISRRAIHYKIKKYAIEPPPGKRAFAEDHPTE